MDLALRGSMTLAEFLEWEERQPMRYESLGKARLGLSSASLGSNDTCFGQEGRISHEELARQAKALGWRPSAVIALGDVHYVLAARHAFPEARALSDTICRGQRRRPRPSNRPATDEPQPPAPLTLTRGDSAALFQRTMRPVAFADSGGVIRIGKRCPRARSRSAGVATS